MDYKAIIPSKALRKFDAICLHNEYLHQNKELQRQLLDCMADMLTEARKEWGELHKDTIESVIKCHTISEAKRKSVIKDQKYAPFRGYFKQIQQEKYEFALQNGSRLTANSLAREVEILQPLYLYSSNIDEYVNIFSLLKSIKS